MTIQLIINSCMCPLSYFIPQSDLVPLDIIAVLNTTPKTQPVDPQVDYINQLYSQDCGGYQLRLDPILTFLTILTENTIALGPATNADIGIYQVEMFVENIVGY